jgi:hypothetical protein
MPLPNSRRPSHGDRTIIFGAQKLPKSNSRRPSRGDRTIIFGAERLPKSNSRRTIYGGRTIIFARRDCQNTSRLVIPLKFIYSSIYISNVLVLTVRCNLTYSVFQIFPLFIPKLSAGFMFYIVQIILIYFFAWIL